ncbi:MAG: lytic transglycosylase domain-containing protein, partial [Rhodospirillales bacterium]|nr:lytic transglycosylase domain-containing protein [Rhodospirillales bacterium]
GDKILLGHVMAQRFLHPTKYRSKYKELKNWMTAYADHPDARRIYELALRRKPNNWRAPKAPIAGGSYFTSSSAKSRVEPRKRLTRSKRNRVAQLKRQIRGLLRNGYTKAVKKLLATKEVKRLFSTVEYDRAKARLGAGYFAAGRDDWAVAWAGEAAERSGTYIPEAHWTSGLALWRLKRYGEAAGHFEAIAGDARTSQWMMSAGAFWAARSHLVNRNPARVNGLLEKAAAHPRTFYGILAGRMLGLSDNFSWSVPEVDTASLRKLAATPGGNRALALVQVGRKSQAERELRAFAIRAEPDQAIGILSLAAHGGMPQLAYRLNQFLYPNGNGYDAAAYPLPDWKPAGGFTVDRALVYALIRQESGFNPKAKSWAGARGLMQLMPGTASFVARDRRYRGNRLGHLFTPETNLTLGQKYIEILLADKKINGDLFLLATAWNGGPGNLNKWRRTTDHLNDPLFFIESIPSRETRIFVERVFANLWIYRNRLGQESPSLDAIAEGRWPVYTALDESSVEVAQNVKNRR